MKQHRQTSLAVRHLSTQIACAIIAASSAWAQAVRQPDPRDGSAANQPVPISEDAPYRLDDDVIELSPFEVSESSRGYQATNTMSGTRLNSRIEDLAASISVVTKQQLVDTAAIDLNDIFLYEMGTEGTHQFTDFEIVTGGASGDVVVDKTGTSPSTANRVRGMGSANISLGGFETTAGIPVDTYNIDAVEISRGPNSNMFGLGNTSGSVNLITSQANTSRRSARAKFQVDSYGGSRAEGQYNIPIKRDVLAVGVYAMHEDKGFTREPSYDKTDRITIAGTFRPTRRTTIRASYEDYTNKNSRPNSLTPRDLVSQWIAAGRPTWDPTTGTLTTPDGTKTANWGNRATLFVPGGGVDLYSDSFITRINQYVENGRSVYMTPGYRPGTPAATAVPGPITPSIANSQYYYNLASGHVYDYEKDVLWKPVGISNKALYDWENLNFAASNYGTKDARTANITVEQTVLQTDEHYLALQGAYFSQKADGWSRDFVGSSGGIAATLMVDINEKNLDGSDNPYFLRPFMAGSEPQIRRSIDTSETYRIQSAYRWDLSRRESWLKWLGTHSIVGYGETRDRISGTPAYRSYILPQHDWYTEYNTDGTIRTKVGNSYRMTYRYYLGDTNGYNADYGPSRIAESGDYTLRWYDGRTGQWVDETVRVEELFDANRLKREQRYTLGVVWQGSMLKDRIIPTIGLRNDKLTEYEGPSRTWDANGYPDINPMWSFEDPNFAYSKGYGEGKTKTAGVVVKPFKWLHLFYNQSDSFRPAGLAYDIHGKVLTNPEGEGKDYGVAFTLLNGKLSIRYNQYEMVETNARTGGSSGTMTSRLQRIDFDITRSSNRAPDSTDRWHLEASAYRWVLAEHRISDKTALSNEQVEAYRREAWEKYIEPAGLPFAYREFFMGGSTKSFADTNTSTSRGREIEINYNPTQYLSLKGSISQKKAFDSGISVANTEWMNDRLQYWQQIMIPSDLMRYDSTSGTWEPDPIAGKSWWTTWDSNNVSTTNLTPQKWFQDNVQANMALINARAGQKKPQLREYSASMLARYNLAGLGTDNFLKNMNVSAAVRWADDSAIGYMANFNELSSSGQYYMYDASRPIYGDQVFQADFMANYRLSLFSGRVKCLLQLNVRNAFESGGLEVVGVNPDGQARDFRIVDPRQFILSATFDF